MQPLLTLIPITGNSIISGTRVFPHLLLQYAGLLSGTMISSLSSRQARIGACAVSQRMVVVTLVGVPGPLASEYFVCWMLDIHSGGWAVILRVDISMACFCEFKFLNCISSSIIPTFLKFLLITFLLSLYLVQQGRLAMAKFRWVEHPLLEI